MIIFLALDIVFPEKEEDTPSAFGSDHDLSEGEICEVTLNWTRTSVRQMKVSCPYKPSR